MLSIEYDPKEFTSLIKTVGGLRFSDLSYMVPSKNVTHWREGLGYDGYTDLEDFENFSLYVHDSSFFDETDFSSDSAFENLRPLLLTYYYGNPDGKELIIDTKEYVSRTINGQEVEAMKFTGRLEYTRSLDDYLVSQKTYGYSFVYDDTPVIVICILKDINQSEETYQKIQKLVDDVFNSFSMKEE